MLKARAADSCSACPSKSDAVENHEADTVIRSRGPESGGPLPRVASGRPLSMHVAMNDCSGKTKGVETIEYAGNRDGRDGLGRASEPASRDPG